MSERGPIAWMARHGVAANLLMVLIIAAGVFASQTIVQEVFPEFSLDRVRITVPYPGATPDEVEESILQKIEEQIEGVEDIKEIQSVASEGRGVVVAELKLGADMGRTLDDIKAEVDQITTFPEQAERPEVREVTNRQSVIRLALYGDVDDRALKEIAYRLEDELSALEAVSFVQTSAVRDYEISIEVPRETLRAYGLSLPQLARRVGAASLELSAGSIDTDTEQVRVRTLGQNYTGRDFDDIIVISRPDGAQIRLGDIAEIDDGFVDADLITRYNGENVAFVEVFRTSDEQVLDVVTAVERHLDEVFLPTLPAGVSLDVWENSAEDLRDRLALLLKNGGLGLALVLLALTLFLNVRLAFWTAVGIGISFVGTIAVMDAFGASINQISLFAFILAVGIVVDDAIVVGENIFSRRERGDSPGTASVKGAQRIAAPVTFAVLTTVTAFTPLLFVPGTVGKIISVMPLVVISVLLLSLIESLLILPYHLSHMPDAEDENRVFRFIHDIQDRVHEGLERFVAGPLDRMLRFAVTAPSVVIASALALILVAISLVPAGIMRVEFFPQVEGDRVAASLEMPVGTTLERTDAIVRRIEEAGFAVADRLESERADDRPDLVQAVYTTVGRQPLDSGPGGRQTASGANLAGVQFRLLKAAEREVSATRFERLWREEVGRIPVAESVSFASSVVGVGADIQVELSHPDTERLGDISTRTVDALGTISGVYDIKSDLDEGTREIQLSLLPAARTLGLDLETVAAQVRAAFFGAEALRVQRGREEVRVYVRLPERQRDTVGDIEQYRIRIPGGGEVQLDQVARVELGRSPSVINRTDGRRVVTVTAEVDTAQVTANRVTSLLQSEILPGLRGDYPELAWTFGGEQEEQAESNAALAQGFGLALVVVYGLLAIPFRSYVQPLVVMSAIPFGIIGAFIGHLLLGLPLSILSLFGIIGLSGVVVNDSLVMVDFINERLRDGESRQDAVIAGAKARFRPILLTSITTFLSVAPLTFEQSFQAQFLIPMAASIGFGILFATVILMLLVPALAMLHLDLVGPPRSVTRAPARAGAG